MAQITLTHSGGTSFALEIARGTLQQQDCAADKTESFYPHLRQGLGQTGSCTVFLYPDEQPEITAKTYLPKMAAIYPLMIPFLELLNRPDKPIAPKASR